MQRPALSHERGSAVAEYVLVSGLLLVVVLGVVQLAFGLWIRTALIDAAAEGARYAALHGADPAGAEQRVREVLDLAGAPYRLESIALSREVRHGLDVMALEVTAPLPVIGVLGPSGVLQVTGHAVTEG